MTELNYSKRELDSKFDHIANLVTEKAGDLATVMARVETQTIKTNGRVNGLESRESERRGASKWAIGVGSFLSAVLVSYLAWVGVQLFSIHGIVQQAVTDALVPYAK